MNKFQFNLPKQTTFNFGSKVTHALGGATSSPPVALSSIKFTAAAARTPVDAPLHARAPEPNPRTSAAARAFGFCKKEAAAAAEADSTLSFTQLETLASEVETQRYSATSSVSAAPPRSQNPWTFKVRKSH